jgi:hypothetical protein
MGGVLVDSDILIEVLRGRKPEVTRRWADTGLRAHRFSIPR